jgi:hypothetical protein
MTGDRHRRAGAEAARHRNHQLFRCKGLSQDAVNTKLVHFKPAQPGEPEIEDNEIGCVLLQVLKGFNTVGGLGQLKAGEVQRGSPQAPQIDIVVNNEDHP